MRTSKNRPLPNWVYDLPFRFYSDDSLAYLIRLISLMVVLFASALVLYALNQVFEWLVWWRYWLVIVIGFLLSYLTAARYIKDLYELDSFSDALTYLVACSLMRSFRPYVRVDKGRLVKHPDEINLIDRIGGPGTVIVQDYNVVLFEKLTGLSRVVGKGYHDILRYEFIRQVVNLDEQHHPLENIEAVTMDGIPVRVSRIHLRFKLREREADWVTDRGSTTEGETYREAVKNLATNRLVSETGYLTMGEMTEMIVVEAVKKFLNRHTIDQIITPDDRTVDSRQALKNELTGPEVRAAMKDIGVRLVGIELGAFEFPDTPIDTFRLGKWKETKRGEIKVLEAEGRAYELSRQDAVRSKTQAEMIQGIIDALEDLEIDDVEDLDTLIKIRSAQILDTWSGLYRSKSGEDFSLSRYMREKEDQEDQG